MNSVVGCAVSARKLGVRVKVLGGAVWVKVRDWTGRVRLA